MDPTFRAYEPGGGGGAVRVFLTGGTGLIGSHVAERLRRRGDAVIALVRSSSDTRHLQALGCETVVGDVLDPPAEIAARIEGCDAVVHGAARVFRGGSRADYLRANVEGTERVLQAAERAAPRVVHLSSVAVYAGLPFDGSLHEERWRDADPRRQAPYAASKHLSELAAWRLHEAGAIGLTTLRPSVVYGERDRAAAPILIRYASLPLVPLPGSGRARLPLVYAGNVAAAVVAALDRPGSVGRAYNVALDQPITARELVIRIAAELGRTARIVPVPAAPLRALAALLDGITRPLPFADGRPVRRAVRSLTTDNPYDTGRARLELGWSRHTPHAEGVRRTLEWWRSRDTE